MHLKRRHLCYSLLSCLLVLFVAYVVIQCLSPLTVAYAGEAAELSSTSALTRLRVMTYNIQSRPLLDPCAAKAPLIGEKLRAYDLVGLQESFAAEDLLFRAARPLQGIVFSKRRHPFKLVSSGLAVLTKLPIREKHAEYFQEEGSLENRLGSKGVLMTRCDVNGSPLDFYTTHLAAGEGQKPIDSKLQELKQILLLIEKQSPPDHAVILCGDFNLKLQDLKSVEASGLVHVAVELKQQKQTFIDHVFYRPGKLGLKPVSWKVLKQEFRFPDGQPLSDHAPVEVVFELPSREP